MNPMPWYVAGPLIGLLVPALLLLGGKLFGVSANLRHMCAIAAPSRISFFRYDWRSAGLWNLTFAAGIVLGALLAVSLWPSASTVEVSAATQADLAALGVASGEGLVPSALFSWSSLLTVPGFITIVVGGFLVGFGARYAGGCTSGHAISGLANLQLPSLIAVVSFFAGGLFVTYVVLPWLLAS